MSGNLTAAADHDRLPATAVGPRDESAIKASLAAAAPNVPFLGEEGGGDADSDRRRWVLDPIDGTINFARSNPLCTTSLSLLVAGQPVLRIVDAPFLSERHRKAGS